MKVLPFRWWLREEEGKHESAAPPWAENVWEAKEFYYSASIPDLQQKISYEEARDSRKWDIEWLKWFAKRYV